MRRLSPLFRRWPILFVNHEIAVADCKCGFVHRASFHTGSALRERLRRDPRLLGKLFRTTRSETRIPIVRKVEADDGRAQLPGLELLAARDTRFKYRLGGADENATLTSRPPTDGGDFQNSKPISIPRKKDNAEKSVAKETERAFQILEIAAIRKRPLFWRDLFLSSQRRFGIDGVKLVWNKFRTFHVYDLPDLYSIQEFWDTLLPLVFEDDSVRESLIEYVQEVHTHYNRSPPQQSNFYCRVIGHALSNEPKNASAYHEQLSFLVPTRRQLKELVCEIAADSRSLIFQEFCNGILSFKDMYGDIVPMIFDQRGFDTGYRWHLFLGGSGHTPEPIHLERFGHLFQPSSVGKPLRAKSSAMEATQEAPAATTSSANKDVSDFWGILSLLERQILLHNIPKKTISDKTCARFFATTFFSVPSIVNGLRLLSFDAIGALALRALITRTASNKTCDIAEARDYLAELQKAGITLQKSIFCNLVRTFVAEDNGQLLHDLVTCDLHSDTFEDTKLQERLLAQYITSNDEPQIRRTLAVLSIATNARTRETKILNLLLRAAVTRNDEITMQQILDKLLDTHTPLTHRSRTFVVKSLVLREGVPRISVVNLLRVINIWKRLATHGTVIDPFEWLGLLRLCREINSASMLSTYIDLLTWVSTHYRTTDFQATEGSFQTYAMGIPKRRILGPKFWSTLLPGLEIWDFLRWSMSIATDKGSDAYRLLRGSSFAERVNDLASHPFLSGVRFLRRLRSLGVPVDEHQIKRVCLARLKFIFGRIGSARRAQRRMRRFRALASIEEYVLAIESIWGSNVFSRKGTVIEFSNDFLPPEYRKNTSIEGDLSHFMPAIEESLHQVDQSLLNYEDHPSSSTDEQLGLEDIEDSVQEPPAELNQIYGGIPQRLEGDMKEVEDRKTSRAHDEVEIEDKEVGEIERALAQRAYSS